LFPVVHAVEGPQEIGGFAIVPIAAQANPRRVHGFNELDLFRTAPDFESLLATDGSTHILMRLEPNEAIAVIARGETFVFFHLC